MFNRDSCVSLMFSHFEVTTTILVVVLLVSGCGQDPSWQLVAPASFGANEHMGHSVAIGDDFAVIGAIDMENQQRTAIVYRRHGNAWKVETTLDMDGSYSSFVPGYSNIEIHGQAVAIKTFRGVFIYRFTRGAWNKEAFISSKMLGGSQIDRFSFIGDTLAIGSMKRGSGYNLHIVSNTDGAWSNISHVETGDKYKGGDIALEQGILAYHSIPTPNNHETVIVVRQNKDNEWVEEQTLVSPDNDRGFGTNIAIDNTSIFISKRFVCSIYEYTHDGNRWVPIKNATTLSMKKPCGSLFAVSGDTMIVGIYNASATIDDSKKIDRSGGFRLLKRSNNGWQLVSEVFQEPPVKMQFFGFDVDIDGKSNRVIVSAWSIFGLGATIGDMSGGLLGNGNRSPQPVITRGATIYNIDKLMTGN